MWTSSINSNSSYFLKGFISSVLFLSFFINLSVFAETFSIIYHIVELNFSIINHLIKKK